jgi:hypothetical protein
MTAAEIRSLSSIFKQLNKNKGKETEMQKLSVEIKYKKVERHRRRPIFSPWYREVNASS